MNSFDHGKLIVISCGSLSRSEQYSEAKVCLFDWDDNGVLTSLIEGGVSEIAIFRTFAQGINTEEVSQHSGIVSEKTTPFGERDTFCFLI